MKVLTTKQIMRLEYNKESIKSSFQNLKMAIDKESNQEIYTSIGELLLWIVTTDDWYKVNGLKDYETRKNEDCNGKLLYGIRYAFNSLKHDMSFFEIHTQDYSLAFPATYPFKPRVIWTLDEDVLDGERKNQTQNYIKHLRGKNVKNTFEKTIDFLDKEFEKVKLCNF